MCVFSNEENLNVFACRFPLYNSDFFLVSGEIPEGVGDGRTENQDSNRGGCAA